MKNSKIQWTDHTWNIINGCKIDTPGCIRCYAMRLAGGRLKHHPSREGLTEPSKAGPVWNGKVRMHRPWLYDPLRATKPAKWFVCAHGDLFYEGVPDEWIDEVFGVMALARHQTFQVLTKRSERMRDYINSRHKLIPTSPLLRGILGEHMLPIQSLAYQAYSRSPRCTALKREFGSAYWSDIHSQIEWPLPNVWLGVSIEDQARAHRAVELCHTPAAVRWISAEPLLGALDLEHVEWRGGPINVLTNRLIAPAPSYQDYGVTTGKLDLVIAGGESGPGWRGCDVDHFRGLREQCKFHDVSFFMKQMPGRKPIPEDLQIFEEPKT